MKMLKNIHVLLLKGGFGPEREVSLESAKACSKAIKENGHYKIFGQKIPLFALIIPINDI